MSEPADDLIPTRATLLARLKDWRDASSWQDFFDTYWQLIYRVALKSGLTETEAQDVVQETMVAVARHMPAFQYDPKLGSFKAWLLNLTRWRITDQFRARGPVVRLPGPSLETTTDHRVLHDAIAPGNPLLDEIWESEWEQNLFNAAVARVKRRLDPRKYQIFDFYVNKGWPADKVADSFKVPIDQVYLAKHRVTEMIRNEVRKLESERPEFGSLGGAQPGR